MYLSSEWVKPISIPNGRDTLIFKNKILSPMITWKPDSYIREPVYIENIYNYWVTEEFL